MSQELVVRGRYVDHTFVPDGRLPDAEGSAELIITPDHPGPSASIFDLFGKAPRLRPAQDIGAQIEEERKDWGEP
jgi:hypothetical protein